MDLDFSPEDLAFQAEARQFLAEAYPKVRPADVGPNGKK